MYILIVSYLCGYILPQLFAFLWQRTDPFVRDLFALSQDFSQLLQQPWTAITYSFFHASFIHCFFNAIMLYFVGILFMNLFTPKRFLGIYIAGVVAGGLFFMAYLCYFSGLCSSGGLPLGRICRDHGGTDILNHLHSYT